MRSFLASALLIAATAAHAETRVRHAFSASAARGQVQRVVIDIPAGEIIVRNGASDRLTVSGQVSRDPDGPSSRDEQQRIVDDISVEIYVADAEAVVRRRFGPDARGFSAEKFTSFDVVVELPQGLHVDVQTRFGEVEIDGRFGNIDVDLRAGEVDVRIPRGDVRELSASCRMGEVTTSIGDELVKREGFLPRRTRFLNPAGRSDVNVHVTAGEVRVQLTE